MCVRGDETLYVEVKGTTTAGEEILLTPNEVRFARANKSAMALYVLQAIRLGEGVDDAVEVTGGTPLVLSPWDVELGELCPVGFSWKLPAS